MTWDDIPVEHQNGIILGYKLYLRKASTVEEWLIHEIDSKSFSKTGLEFWTIYDVKVSGRTSVGEGNSSEVIKVRTDEDGKHTFLSLISSIYHFASLMLQQFLTGTKTRLLEEFKRLFASSKQVFGQFHQIVKKLL